MMDQREAALSGKSAREAERLISGNLYQLADDSGLPHHYLIQTVGVVSSSSDCSNAPPSSPFRS